MGLCVCMLYLNLYVQCWQGYSTLLVSNFLTRIVSSFCLSVSCFFFSTALSRYSSSSSSILLFLISYLFSGVSSSSFFMLSFNVFSSTFLGISFFLSV